MALINCSECKQEISSKADKCPYCGNKMKKGGFGCGTFILIGIICFVGFYIVGSNSESSSVITDEQTYSQSWRSPRGTEFTEIGRIIVSNGIKVCGEYYIKEIEDKEYVIACSSDGSSWDYFVVYTRLDKIYRANEEMESKLHPPR
ncbi:hypothetical protein RBH94_15145 [Aestuariibaculum sp. YM273]|uniref:hypothetical protein n=1 Tax=Aestuariibaculum sp. YM273 TaxID=3070659 RepID=UPI0027DB9590|nr:hypothetical protein [Aestuariibaculum sp. YM273]WMI65387.1 hypothetical protein RBH94_15145 [Aestuariibaculum sp. YM273]